MKLPGSIYQRTYNYKGEKRQARNYTIQYFRNGRKRIFTTDTDDYERAAAILHEKVAGTLKLKEFADARPETVTMNVLFDLINEVNKEAQLKTAGDVERLMTLHLRPWFGRQLARAVTSQDVREFKDHRLNQIRKLKAQNRHGKTAKATAKATINKELAYVKRAFKLGMQEDPPLVSRVPKIALYNVDDNVRSGLLSEASYQKLLHLLPSHARMALVISYLTGARKGEVRQILKDKIDFVAARIDLPGCTTKNGEPRFLPIYREMRVEIVRAIAAGSPACPYLLQNDGQPVREWKKSWATACMSAGVPMALFHDLRRTACTNMIEAGMTERDAMSVSGHKTPHVFRRYHIQSAKALKESTSKLEAFMAAKAEETRKMTDIRSRKVQTGAPKSTKTTTETTAEAPVTRRRA